MNDRNLKLSYREFTIKEIIEIIDSIKDEINFNALLQKKLEPFGYKVSGRDRIVVLGLLAFAGGFYSPANLSVFGKRTAHACITKMLQSPNGAQKIFLRITADIHHIFDFYHGKISEKQLDDLAHESRRPLDEAAAITFQDVSALLISLEDAIITYFKTFPKDIIVSPTNIAACMGLVTQPTHLSAAMKSVSPSHYLTVTTSTTTQADLLPSTTQYDEEYEKWFGEDSNSSVPSEESITNELEQLHSEVSTPTVFTPDPDSNSSTSSDTYSTLLTTFEGGYINPTDDTDYRPRKKFRTEDTSSPAILQLESNPTHTTNSTEIPNNSPRARHS